MRRNLNNLTRRTYDLLVIGGGIYGAWVARDAAMRGLAVALLEKDDFGHATSANSLKIVHGGLRYLQHADIRRVRESVRERATLLRIAPHLIHPLPCLMPTYGHMLKGREMLQVALLLNDLVSYDRDRQQDRHHYLPPSRLVSPRECAGLLPDVGTAGLTGGALWYDGQMYNSERLTLAVVRSASMCRAEVANYVKVTGFIRKRARVAGVEAMDALTGERFSISARTVVNTTGPWVPQVLAGLGAPSQCADTRFAKAINVITRSLNGPCAFSVASKRPYRDADDKLGSGTRQLFVTPWRGKSLIGTAYTPYHGHPDDFRVTEADVQDFLDDINQAWPAARLRLDDVEHVHGGLVLGSGTPRSGGSVQRARHSQIHDHRADGIEGVVTVLGVKYTTARSAAERAVDRVIELLGRAPTPSCSAVVPLHGGDVRDFGTFLSDAMRQRPRGLPEATVRRLVYNYGSAYPDVIEHMPEIVGDAADCEALVAEVRYAVREEMAQTLRDVVFRRTEVGTAGHPGDETLRLCAEVIGRELQWSLERTERELSDVEQRFFLGMRAKERAIL